MNNLKIALDGAIAVLVLGLVVVAFVAVLHPPKTSRHYPEPMTLGNDVGPGTSWTMLQMMMLTQGGHVGGLPARDLR